jgi:hypothetical protein
MPDTYRYFSQTSSPGTFNNGSYNSDIVIKRNELDTRLNNLYKKRKMIEETQQKDINANVYANIMLTVLGTCLLYFSFVKIVK